MNSSMFLPTKSKQQNQPLSARNAYPPYYNQYQDQQQRVDMNQSYNFGSQREQLSGPQQDFDSFSENRQRSNSLRKEQPIFQRAPDPYSRAFSSGFDQKNTIQQSNLQQPQFQQNNFQQEQFFNQNSFQNFQNQQNFQLNQQSQFSQQEFLQFQQNQQNQSQQQNKSQQFLNDQKQSITQQLQPQFQPKIIQVNQNQFQASQNISQQQMRSKESVIFEEKSVTIPKSMQQDQFYFVPPQAQRYILSYDKKSKEGCMSGKEIIYLENYEIVQVVTQQPPKVIIKQQVIQEDEIQEEKIEAKKEEQKTFEDPNNEDEKQNEEKVEENLEETETKQEIQKKIEEIQEYEEQEPIITDERRDYSQGIQVPVLYLATDQRLGIYSCKAMSTFPIEFDGYKRNRYYYQIKIVENYDLPDQQANMPGAARWATLASAAAGQGRVKITLGFCRHNFDLNKAAIVENKKKEFWALDLFDGEAYSHNILQFNQLFYKYIKHPMDFPQKGDVIGVLIDLEQGTISYYKNGRNLGVCFNEGPGAFTKNKEKLYPFISIYKCKVQMYQVNQQVLQQHQIQNPQYPIYQILNGKIPPPVKDAPLENFTQPAIQKNVAPQVQQQPIQNYAQAQPQPSQNHAQAQSQMNQLSSSSSIISQLSPAQPPQTNPISQLPPQSKLPLKEQFKVMQEIEKLERQAQYHEKELKSLNEKLNKLKAML